jgi:hypothetical protein
MTENERLARTSIEKTLAVCAQAGDARKAGPYSLCFTVDGVLDLGDPRLEGRDAIRRYMEAPSPIPLPRHRSMNFVEEPGKFCGLT